jgi:hypothetical protein
VLGDYVMLHSLFGWTSRLPVRCHGPTNEFINNTHFTPMNKHIARNVQPQHKHKYLPLYSNINYPLNLLPLLSMWPLCRCFFVSLYYMRNVEHHQQMMRYNAPHISTNNKKRGHMDMVTFSPPHVHSQTNYE